MPAPKGNSYAAKSPGEAATSFLYCRVTPAAKARWVRAARRANQTLSEWVIHALDNHAASR